MSNTLFDSDRAEYKQEKQAIEEMAKVIETTEQIARDAHCGIPSPRMYAKDLYWKGYRKQREVIKEFVKRFERYIGNCTFTMGQTNDILYALKKATEEMKGGAE